MGSRIDETLVVAPVPLGQGGLGAAVGEFAEGLEALGYEPHFVGPGPRSRLIRAANSRPFRRAFGMAPTRRLGARAVRRAVPRSGWDLSYSTPGSVPVERGAGTCVIYQATRHPRIEREALQRGERETGGQGDLSRSECRRREYEIEHAGLIHVTSLAVRDEFLAAGIAPERLIHSYHGVDLDRFRPGAKAERLKVAFIGPLSMRKGVDIVADLETRLGGDTTIEAVGGPICPWSRRVADRASFVPGQTARDTLATSHALVLPSRSDGFSFVVLEALASGTIPIVTPEVGASEIVRRLDERLVIDRAEFAEASSELLPRLDFGSLAPRARALAEEFDRRQTSKATVGAVLGRAEDLLAP